MDRPPLVTAVGVFMCHFGSYTGALDWALGSAKGDFVLEKQEDGWRL